MSAADEFPAWLPKQATVDRALKNSIRFLLSTAAAMPSAVLADREQSLPIIAAHVFISVWTFVYIFEFTCTPDVDDLLCKLIGIRKSDKKDGQR